MSNGLCYIQRTSGLSELRYYGPCHVQGERLLHCCGTALYNRTDRETAYAHGNFSVPLAL